MAGRHVPEQARYIGCFIRAVWYWAGSWHRINHIPPWSALALGSGREKVDLGLADAFRMEVRDVSLDAPPLNAVIAYWAPHHLATPIQI